MEFSDSSTLANLIKMNTCFKGKVSFIDLILTERKFSFKFTSTYETRISNHHHMINTMLESCFQSAEPKILNYRDLKILPEPYEEDLSEAIIVVIHFNLIIFLTQSWTNIPLKKGNGLGISNFIKQCKNVVNLNNKLSLNILVLVTLLTGSSLG